MDRKPQGLKNISDCDEYSEIVASLSIPWVSNILHIHACYKNISDLYAFGPPRFDKNQNKKLNI